MSAPIANWWKDGTCYQIWPASYKDTTGSGVGDIQGIISTLDYIKDLGVTIIWLSPCYTSPKRDMGYDISNYEDIDPTYGSLEDVLTLIKEVHARGMKLILDLVINHTSDEHPWFLESMKDTTNPKSDWYIWKKPRYVNGERKEPNNWRSLFSGSAWKYVPERDEYYLHLFAPEQADLNWENEDMRKAIYATAIDFWLQRGIDGFRVDTVNIYSKHPDFPDAEIDDPGTEYQSSYNYVVNGPRMHEYLKEIRRDVLDKYEKDIPLIGELAPTEDFADTLAYITVDAKELNMIFDFTAVMVGRPGKTKYDFYEHKLPEFKKAMAKPQAILDDTDAWTTVFLENHDQGRSISRFAAAAIAEGAKPEWRGQAGKLLATLMVCLSGTLFIYQGQEIGMVNIPHSWDISEYKDVNGIGYYEEWKTRYKGDKAKMIEAELGQQRLGRDNARTPVQWNASANAGFSTAQPWMRVHDNYKEVNVEQQQKDKDSVLEFWKKGLKLRTAHRELLIYGGFEMVDLENEKIFAFVKKALKNAGGKRILVLLNFSVDEVDVKGIMDSIGYKETDNEGLLLMNVSEGKTSTSLMGPWESRVYSLN